MRKMFCRSRNPVVESEVANFWCRTELPPRCFAAQFASWLLLAEFVAFESLMSSG